MGGDACVEAWQARILDAAVAGQSLRLRGGGSKDFYGQQLMGELLDKSTDKSTGKLLDTRDYAGIVAYEPSELFVTARCGTRLAELEATLAEHGQMLACELPHFGGDATLGGAVAAGLAGPRRAQLGAVRDFVLGVKLLDGNADVLNFGGQVMKNVAGYDVPRLLAGSLGTLGLLLEVSLKVLPLPPAERTLRFDLPQARALALLQEWGGQAVPVSASAWYRGMLSVRLSGAMATVDAVSKALGEKLGAEFLAEEEAEIFWRSLRDQTHEFFAGDARKPLWRLALPPTCATLDLADTFASCSEPLIEWGGAQRWLRGPSDPVQAVQAAQAIRTAAARLGGHATLFRADAALKAAVGVFQPLAAPLLRIHRKLKQAFDPRSVFNPGRMYREF